MPNVYPVAPGQRILCDGREYVHPEIPPLSDSDVALFLSLSPPALSPAPVAISARSEAPAPVAGLNASPPPADAVAGAGAPLGPLLVRKDLPVTRLMAHWLKGKPRSFVDAARAADDRTGINITAIYDAAYAALDAKGQ
jgi:hypothetical protein